jgi:predicted nicotinamide N-methyase
MTTLDDLMEQITSKYAVETVPLRIGSKTLRVLQIKNYEEYLAGLIEAEGIGASDLPFWAKIWEASLLLAYFLGKQPVVLGQRILEIGAGIGVVGVYAALCGHRITVTDINEDALLFARANALLNGVPNMEVRRLDWRNNDSHESYESIVGSEVVYDRESYPALVRFLLDSITPNGMIFLAKNAQLNAPKFFKELTKHFELKEKIHNIRADGEDQRIALYAVRLKENGRGRDRSRKPVSLH